MVFLPLRRGTPASESVGPHRWLPHLQALGMGTGWYPALLMLDAVWMNGLADLREEKSREVAKRKPKGA